MNEELKALLLTMNVPVKRIEMGDVRWFSRNLAAQNSSHPNFERATILIRDALRSQVVGK